MCYQTLLRQMIRTILAALFLVGCVPPSMGLQNPTNTHTPVSTPYPTYSDPEAGISFRYPVFLTPKTETTKDRDSSGILIKTTRILLESSDPVYAIYIDIIEDPTTSQDYPPDEGLLRTFIAMDLGQLDTKKTEANHAAVMAAVKSAVITKISDFPAATYQLTLDDTPVGQAYIRGAVAISRNRSFTLFHIGSIEPDAPGSVTKEFVDEAWLEFVESISLVEYN